MSWGKKSCAFVQHVIKIGTFSLLYIWYVQQLGCAEVPPCGISNVKHGNRCSFMRRSEIPKYEL